MATRLMLSYDREFTPHVQAVEGLVGARRGTHERAVRLDEVVDALRAAGANAEANRLLIEAKDTPTGEILRMFREGFGRVTISAAVVMRHYGYDPAFGIASNSVHAAAILAAQGCTLEQVSAMRDSDLSLTWG